MSIATAITNLQGKIANAYTAIQEKGGTLPATQDAANLSATIEAIPSGGGTPKWGFTSLEEVCYIDANGMLIPFGGLSGTTLNFTGVKKIDSPTMGNMFTKNQTLHSASFPDLSVINTGGMNKTFTSSTISSVSFPELLSVNNTAFQEAFSGCSNMTSVSFPKLSSVAASAFTSAFYNCKGLTSVSFPNLAKVDGVQSMKECFKGCTSLTNVSFPELSNVNDQSSMEGIFNGCTALTSVSFPKLKQSLGNRVFGDAFVNTQVTTLSFPELSAIHRAGGNDYYAIFSGNNTLTRIDLPKLTVMSEGTTDDVSARYMFGYCQNLVEIHFGVENQSLIEGSRGYSTKWGAPNANCQVYFDL